MARGKQTCKILKEIRRQIAEANGIEFVTSECRYKGDCLGTCPKCEAEVRYLEQELRARSLAGKAVAIAGISAASFAMLMPIGVEAQVSTDLNILHTDSLTATRVDSVKVRGIVMEEIKTDVDSIVFEELVGASVMNLSNGKGTVTDIDGKFEIDACVGDSIKVSFIGFHSKTVSVENTSEPITVVLDEIESVLEGEVVTVYTTSIKREENHYLDLNVTDEHGNVIAPEDIYVERIWIDNDGDEDSECLSPQYFDEKHPCRIYWDYESALQDEDDKPLKEVTLRIEAEGYDDPVTIKVKYPKRHAKKTIKFKHKNK